MIHSRIWTLLVLLAGCCLLGPANATADQIYVPFGARPSVGAQQNYANAYNFGQLFGVHKQASSSRQYSNNYNGYNAAAQAHHQNVITNALQLAGIPISNMISTSSGSSATAGQASGFLDTLKIGKLGLSAGLASDHAGQVGVTRTPDGGILLNLGVLTIGVGQSVEVVTGSSITAQSTGHVSNTQSSSYSQDHSSGVVSVSQSSESQSVAHGVSNGEEFSVLIQGQFNEGPDVTQTVVGQTQSQSDQEYYDKYYQDYYDNYYKNHPEYQQPEQQQPQPQHTQSHPNLTPPASEVAPAVHPQPTPKTQPIVPVQPNDETHFRDHYNINTPLHPSSYASENYFENPASHKDSNYHITPVEFSPEHSVQMASTKTNEDIEGILNKVLPVSETPQVSEGGKSLFDLLDELPKGQHENDVAGGDYGLDVRAESRRKRSLNRPKRRSYRHHYEEEDDDEDDDDDHYHHHHHHHSSGRQHGRGRGYQGDCNEPGHSHHSKPDHNREPSGDIRPIHENTGEEPVDQRPKPIVPFPKALPTAQTTKEAAPRDLSPEFNFDVRSNFNESRRKRDLSLTRTKREEDSFVFSSDEEEKPSAVEATSEAVPAAADAASATTEEEEEFEECELGEKDCEPASLDNRFGFLTGMRRRQRPFGGILGEIVQDVVHTIGDVGHQYQPNYPQYAQQPQYPQQYPQQGPHQPQYPQQGPHQQHPQQYPQQPPQYSHPPQPQYPVNHPQYQQSAGANTQSQNYQDQYGQYQQNGGSSQASNLAADGSGGQLSSANTMQQSYQNQFGSGSKNGAQSQSANFDNHGNLGLSNANANTQHIQGPNGERDEATSGAHSTQQNQFGSATSGSQSDTQNYNENGKHGTQSHGSSQSQFHGNDGSFSGSNSDATSGTFEGPFGIKGTLSSSHSSSFNNGGAGGSSSSANSGSGSGLGGAQSGAQSGSFGGGAGSQANAGSYGGQPDYYGDLPVFG